MEDRCRPTTRLVFELIAIEKINSKDEQLYILQMVAESPHKITSNNNGFYFCWISKTRKTEKPTFTDMEKRDTI
jgi:hypothetical protein